MQQTILKTNCIVRTMRNDALAVRSVDQFFVDLHFVGYRSVHAQKVMSFLGVV
jgi:hypothetical protein